MGIPHAHLEILNLCKEVLGYELPLVTWPAFDSTRLDCYGYACPRSHPDYDRDLHGRGLEKVGSVEINETGTKLWCRCVVRQETSPGTISPRLCGFSWSIDQLREKLEEKKNLIKV
jgi:hypothetical protein